MNLLTADGNPVPHLAGAVLHGLLPARRRVARTRPGRAYLSVGGLDGPDARRIAAAVEAEVGRLEGVKWASVNPVLASVVVSFDDGQVGVGDIADVVGSVEDAHGTGSGSSDALEHPADPDLITRAATALVGDIVGLGFAGLGRLARIPALPVEVASALTGLESVGPFAPPGRAPPAGRHRHRPGRRRPAGPRAGPGRAGRRPRTPGVGAVRADGPAAGVDAGGAPAVRRPPGRGPGA